MKQFIEDVKSTWTTGLLSAWVHDKTLTPKQRKIVEDELIKRGSLIKEELNK